MPTCKRVLFKLSGETLVGDNVFGINRNTIEGMVNNIAEIVKLGVQVTVMIDGGSIFRGVTDSAVGMDHATADYIGILAIAMNALVLQDTMCHTSLGDRIQSALRLGQVVEPHIHLHVICQLEEGRIITLAAGTGNSFFTTDTAVALRDLEIGAGIVFKATGVGGAHTAGPKKDLSTIRYTMITFDEAISCNLRAVDAIAFMLCHDQKLLIKVFSIQEPGALRRVILGEDEDILVHI